LGDRSSENYDEKQLETVFVGDYDFDAAALWENIQARRACSTTPPSSLSPCLAIFDGLAAFLARSIAMFTASLALSVGCEIVIFSPARRASRKMLERIIEFIRLLDFNPTEYNQEQARIPALNGKTSLIRSFPSKVGVRCHSNPRPQTHAREQCERRHCRIVLQRRRAI
jgi:hypothetical protein